jgi:signal transduction histidine kinase
MSVWLTEIATAGQVAHREWTRVDRRERIRRFLLEVGLLAALYYGSAKLGYELGFSGPVAAIVWLPVGVGIAYLYLRDLAFWPGVLLGDLLANDWMRLPAGTALAQTVGNVLEVVLAAYLLRRAARSGYLLGRVDGLVRLLPPLALATMVSATVGTLASRAGGVIDWSAFLTVWRTWWLGDACGALVVVPLALAWWRPLPRLSRPRAVEFAAMLAVTGALTGIAFSSPKALEYLAFPGLIWAALRFGQRGATLALVLVTGVAIWATTNSYGPFHFHSITSSILSTQLFVAVATLSALCVAAIVAERAGFAAGLAESQTALLRAADSERHRIERDLHDGAQQRLVALLVRLRVAEEQLPQEPGRAAQVLRDAETELGIALEELRELSHGTHPNVLTDLGLATAIRSTAARASQRIHLVELPSEPVDAAAEAAAYYVFLEAVTNAQKHAPHAMISIRAQATTRVLTIEISDDGPGGASAARGGGLDGLRQRVEAAGGEFHLLSGEETGTKVAATFPL